MTDKIAFDLVSPERLLLSEKAEMVTIPGREGEMGVMEGHMPLVTTLRPGIIDVKGGDGGDRRFYVSGGFAEVTGANLTVLADEAVPVGELDLDRKIAGAEEDLAKAGDDSGRAQEILDCLKGLRVTH